MTPSRKRNVRTGPETRTVELRHLSVGDPVLSVGRDVFADVTEIDVRDEGRWYVITLANRHAISGPPAMCVKVLVP